MLTLWDDAKLARTTDPATSHQAAAKVIRTGARSRQQNEIERLVRMYQGRTSAELAELPDTDLDRYQIARRLPELEVGRLVRRGDVRKCRSTGNNAVTWWASGGGR